MPVLDPRDATPRPIWAWKLETELKRYIHEQVKLAIHEIIYNLSSHPGSKFAIKLGDLPMGDVAPQSLSVDIANQTASVMWSDDKGDTEGVVAPSDAAIAYSSSDETVVGVDATSGALTFLKEGTTTVTATDPKYGTSSEVLTLTPGAASSFTVAVGDAAPVPVPAQGKHTHKS